MKKNLALLFQSLKAASKEPGIYRVLLEELVPLLKNTFQLI